MLCVAYGYEEFLGRCALWGVCHLVYHHVDTLVVGQCESVVARLNVSGECHLLPLVGLCLLTLQRICLSVDHGIQCAGSRCRTVAHGDVISAGFQLVGGVA